MISVTDGQRVFASFTADVLVYVVVLNLFVEHSDAIVIDSFSISILTAILLKLLLDLIVSAEHWVSDFFKRRHRPITRVLRVFSVWLILFLSKFLILEVVDLVFGEHVELGGFILVAILVIVMMVARQALESIYRALGPSSSGF
ncbi:MAG: hypothetical protein ACR2OI_06115 [Acidimicrobiia bacterium]